MSDQKIILELVKRDQIRKGLNKLKAEGLTPAVIQNPGKDSIIVSGSLIEITKVYKEAGKHHPVEVKLDGKSLLTIIKDIDFDAQKHQIRHVVFSILKQDEKVETEVLIVFVGDAPAQKLSLIVSKQLDHVELEAFPKDLPDEVTVSIEGLREIGDKITVADIVVPSGVTINTEPDRVIAAVEESTVQTSEEAEAEAEADEESTDAKESIEEVDGSKEEPSK